MQLLLQNLGVQELSVVYTGIQELNMHSQRDNGLSRNAEKVIWRHFIRITLNTKTLRVCPNVGGPAT